LLGKSDDGDWTLRVRCSKGTYVRTLCHDIGQALGCGGCMSSLRRTMAAGFTLAESHTLEEVQQAGESLLAPTDSLFRQYPAYRLATEKADRACRCGNPIPASDLAEGLYRVYGLDGQFLCLSSWKNGALISQKNFFGA
jgi:tRNA pseudouridine synthase B